MTRLDLLFELYRVGRFDFCIRMIRELCETYPDEAVLKAHLSEELDKDELQTF